MTLTLNEILKDSAYKLTQFSSAQILALENSIIIKEVRDKATPYITCLVRAKDIKLTPEEVVRQLYLMVLIEDFKYPVNPNILSILIQTTYSYLNASTGFLVAAFQLCQLTVSNAIPIASKPARAKIHQLSSVL